MDRSNESLEFILDPQLKVFFRDQALKACLRSSENNDRNNPVIDPFDFKIETAGLERAANWPQCRFDRFYHFNLGASMKKFAPPIFLTGVLRRLSRPELCPIGAGAKHRGRRFF